MLYSELAILTAGTSLAMGTISLYLGIKKNSSTNILLGSMGLCLTVFFLLPPAGFILEDIAPYPTNILIKRIFIFAYYALIPWFVASYSGFRNRIVPYFLTVETVITYCIMLASPAQIGKPFWSQIAVLAFGTIFVHGLAAGIWQWRKGDQKKSRWLILSMSIYGLLFLATAINQLTDNFLGHQLQMKLFFPIHFHSILFVIIMGLEVVDDALEKNKLERKLKDRDQRWVSFMQHVPAIVLEVDRDGKVTYINDFGAKLLGYSNESGPLHKDWFDNFIRPVEKQKVKKIFDELIHRQKDVPFFKSAVIDRLGREITIDWTSFVTHAEDGQVFGMITIGRDMSHEENAKLEIEKLRMELEKEALQIPRERPLVMPEEIIGTSDAIRYAIQKAQQVAPTLAPVLLEGETGVGKDLLTDIIHRSSIRKAMPLVKVNCGALPKELIEDELFGHEKGAFTSAIQARKGRFELAHGGTIFLDEIGELPLDMQPKLLRVLQNGEFERVGGQQTIKVDVRVIAATNRDLALEVKRGNFRDDLFYRLAVFPITIPPLRKRREDLPALINYFITRKCNKYNKAFEQISKADMQRLIDYPWPGNVRELKNVIERSVITSNGSLLKLDWFLQREDAVDSNVSATLEQIEKDHILKIMEECHWKINGEDGAAERLAMHPNTLRSRMKKLGIIRPVKESN